MGRPVVLVPQPTRPRVLGPTSGAQADVIRRLVRTGKNPVVEPWNKPPHERNRGAEAKICVAVTASFRVLYIFVIIEHASRRLLHWNVTSNPTAAWTLQQLREAIASDHPYRFLVHDRDSIYTQALDTSIANLRLRVLKTPYRSPKANSLCERLIGSLRRECLDWAIPLSEGHLRSLLKMWSTYYNRGRPHMALGPGVPDPPRGVPAPLRPHRHALSASPAVVAKPVLNGLHHDYRLVPCSA